ncbi:MAG: class I SAM-dependent methyltransferase [Candidatus Hodarchaeales archaeon]|jgi:SAM-dependent methyltransferase
MKTAFGASLLAYWNGDREATHMIEREDGYRHVSSVSHLFTESENWPKEEIKALNQIPPKSTILDIGCGVGRVALYLQKNGHKVVGLDSCPEAIELAKTRGLKFTYLSNICDIDKPPIFDNFNVILMIGNNFGICGDENKTEQLLLRLNSFLLESGLIIFSIRDPFQTDKPIHFAYHKKNRQKGRSPGLIRLRIVYRDLNDDWWDLLMVSSSTAEKMLQKTGFTKIALYQSTGSPVYYLVAKKD